MDISYDVITFISRNVFSKRPGEAISADITKLVTFFIKKIFTDSRKVKRIRNFVSKCNLYMCFLIKQNLLTFGEKFLMSAELKGCATLFIYLLDLFQVTHNCSKFHHYGLCVTDFEEGDLFSPPPPIREQFQKAHLEQVSDILLSKIFQQRIYMHNRYSKLADRNLKHQRKQRLSFNI